jgi:hypothetical protein
LISLFGSSTPRARGWWVRGLVSLWLIQLVMAARSAGSTSLQLWEERGDGGGGRGRYGQ